MTSSDIRAKFLDFYKARGHAIIPSAPLVPENDPTTLFTGSGMQPMVPYLLGQPHPLGTRLVDSQKCFRAQDIEEVGDNRHTTFFEMLGNWSLGDYFKTEQLQWLWEFLTQVLQLPPERLYVSVFKGKQQIPQDDESAKIWQSLGVPPDRIFYYDETKNWWSRAGTTASMPVGEPGGPDSEVFYDFGTPHNPKFGEKCHPNCDCGRFMEIGNSVFMTYAKTDTGFIPLEKKNIDFGGGLERLAAAVNNDPDIFNTDLFTPIIKCIQDISGAEYSDPAKTQAMRIIADHIKAASFLIADGVEPSNKGQGYVVRRLLRRAMVKLNSLDAKTEQQATAIADSVVATYKDIYFSQADNTKIKTQIGSELFKFSQTLNKGMKLIGKVSAFDLFQTYGFPVEIIQELMTSKQLKFDRAEFDKAVQAHRDQSRTAAAGMFKGGLADQSETVVKYHTATHLLHQALRDVLGDHVHQQGSNITADRLRFDFSHPAKLTDQEISEVETIVNAKIKADLPVTRVQMPKQTALAEGALAFFPEKYPDITSVYTIGDYSKELCGGPHVTSTGQIGPVRIIKEQAVASGVRRIYAALYGTKDSPVQN